MDMQVSYDIESAQDIQEALKDLLGGIIKEMMETEIDEHLGAPNRSILTAVTIAMAISLGKSIAAAAAWSSRYLRIGNSPLRLRKSGLPIRNWGQVYGELSIIYEGRLSE